MKPPRLPRARARWMLALAFNGSLCLAQLPFEPTPGRWDSGAPDQFEEVLAVPPFRPARRDAARAGYVRPLRGTVAATRTVLDTARGTKPGDSEVARGLNTGATSQPLLFAVGREIPDGDPSGLVDTRVLPVSAAAIRSVSVSLTLSPLGEGGFLGDLYATLAHEDGGYAVLLNRPGRQPGKPFGYSDGVGFSVTFTDDASADIHQYRLAVNGNEDTPVLVPLGGVWQPDARDSDPLLVGLGSPRAAFLTSFSGHNSGGRWTLFLADVSPGGGYRLESWTLSVTHVPEPSVTLALLGLGALGWVVWQRRARQTRSPSPGPERKAPRAL